MSQVACRRSLRSIIEGTALAGVLASIAISETSLASIETRPLPAPGLEGIVAEAAVVVEAVVEDVSYGEIPSPGRLPVLYTTVRARVLRSFRGSTVGDIVEFRTMGGLSTTSTEGPTARAKR